MFSISSNGVKNVYSQIKNSSAGVTKAVKNGIAKTEKLPAAGVGIAAASGMYLVSKSDSDRKKCEKELKKLNLNDETINKVLNAKGKKGKPVFDSKNIKLLTETSKLKDTFFYNQVMFNIDNINSFSKKESSYNNNKVVTYKFEAKSADGVEKSVKVDISNNPENPKKIKDIQTTIITTKGDQRETVIRVWDDESIETATEKSELVTVEDENGDEVTDENVISSESVLYQKEKNKFVKSEYDLDAFNYAKSSKTFKYDEKGVLTDVSSKEYDLEAIKKLQRGEYSDAELKELAEFDIKYGKQEAGKIIEDMKNGEIPDYAYYKMQSNTTDVKDFKNGATVNLKSGITDGAYAEIKRTYRNPRTGRMETLTMKQSDVKGVYNSVITDEFGNTKVESSGKKDADGNIRVVKNFESPDGSTTHYSYFSSKDGNNVKMHYQIKDENGKNLSTVDRTFRRINPNLAYSSVNGHSYVINKDTQNKKYIVTDNSTGEDIVIKFKSIFKNKEAQKNSDIIDRLSGDMLIAMAEQGCKYEHIKDPSDAYIEGNVIRSAGTDDALYNFAHEFGHMKDLYDDEKEFVDMLDNERNDFLSYKFEEIDLADGYGKIALNPEVLQIYEKERADFIKAFPDAEQEIVDYFIDKSEHIGGYAGGVEEVVAENSAILSHDTGNDDLYTRQYYLQKYFPKTMAAMSKHTMPNANLYLNDQK